MASMDMVLVISQNVGNAETGEALLKANGVKRTVKIVPGATKFPRDFQALAVYHNEPNEVNFVKDLLKQYEDVPIKVFIGKS